MDDICEPDGEEPQQVSRISPGPWAAPWETARGYTVEDGNGVEICDVRRGLAHSEANLEAIAEVPRMLEILLYVKRNWQAASTCAEYLDNLSVMVQTVLLAMPRLGGDQ